MTRALSLVLATLVAVLGLVVPAAPAQAAECGSQSGVWGGGAEGGVNGDCTVGGGKVPGYDNPLPGTTWVRYEEYGRTRICTDREGNPSWMAMMYGVRNGVKVTDNLYRCVVQHLVGGAPTLADAKLVIKAPKIDVDFTGDLLTGAPVQFGFATPGRQQQAIPNFNAYVEARPTTYRWDFGDGTTSTEANPVHTYTNKHLNGSNQAVITVQVTYEAFLFAQTADGQPVAEQNLGEIPLQTTLEKTVVEVWSALTQEAR